MLHGLLDLLVKLGNGGGVENVGDQQLDTQTSLDRADQPHRHERLSVQVEEAVIDPDARHPEHLGEQRAQDLLPRGLRRPVGRQAFNHRLGQRLAIHLPVRGQRQRVERDERRRHHVLGQQLCRVRPQPVDVDLTSLSDDVSDQALLAAGDLARDHERVRQPLVSREHALDLGQLDPVAADLDLVT